MLEAAGFACRFVRPPRGFAPPVGVTTIDRLGQEVRVTTVERTIADLFDRYDLAGDAEELFNSLDLVARGRRRARALGKATAAGALGFWLEREQKRLDVPNAALEELRTLMPSQARYTLDAKSGGGKTARGWKVTPHPARTPPKEAEAADLPAGIRETGAPVRGRGPGSCPVPGPAGGAGADRPRAPPRRAAHQAGRVAYPPAGAV